jgi:ribonuclease P protein component
MTRFRFQKIQHLRSKSEFERVYKRNCKAVDGIILLFGDLNSDRLTRIGLSVSRKHGGAVVRNRLKRLLREAFRLAQFDLPAGLDLIAIPLVKERADVRIYKDSLIASCRRLKRRLEASTSTS